MKKVLVLHESSVQAHTVHQRVIVITVILNLYQDVPCQGQLLLKLHVEFALSIRIKPKLVLESTFIREKPRLRGILFYLVDIHVRFAVVFTVETRNCYQFQLFNPFGNRENKRRFENFKKILDISDLRGLGHPIPHN